MSSDRYFWSWLAGFVDGEGCYTWRNRCGIRLHINNTKLSVIKYIHANCGGRIEERNSRKHNPNSSRSWMIWWYRKECISITRHILPYLFLKKEQAKLILKAPLSITGVHFTESERRLRDEIQQGLKELNRKGHWEGKVY